MKISLNWIKEFVDIPAKYSPKELAELLTLRTCEVEGYEDQGRGPHLGHDRFPNRDRALPVQVLACQGVRRDLKRSDIGSITRFQKKSG